MDRRGFNYYSSYQKNNSQLFPDNPHQNQRSYPNPYFHTQREIPSLLYPNTYTNHLPIPPPQQPQCFNNNDPLTESLAGNIQSFCYIQNRMQHQAPYLMNDHPMNYINREEVNRTFNSNNHHQKQIRQQGYNFPQRFINHQGDSWRRDHLRSNHIPRNESNPQMNNDFRSGFPGRKQRRPNRFSSADPIPEKINNQNSSSYRYHIKTSTQSNKVTNQSNYMLHNDLKTTSVSNVNPEKHQKLNVLSTSSPSKDNTKICDHPKKTSESFIRSPIEKYEKHLKIRAVENILDYKIRNSSSFHNKEKQNNVTKQSEKREKWSYSLDSQSNSCPNSARKENIFMNNSPLSKSLLAEKNLYRSLLNYKALSNSNVKKYCSLTSLQKYGKDSSGSSTPLSFNKKNSSLKKSLLTENRCLSENNLSMILAKLEKFKLAKSESKRAMSPLLPSLSFSVKKVKHTRSQTMSLSPTFNVKKIPPTEKGESTLKSSGRSRPMVRSGKCQKELFKDNSIEKTQSLPSPKAEFSVIKKNGNDNGKIHGKVNNKSVAETSRRHQENVCKYLMKRSISHGSCSEDSVVNGPISVFSISSDSSCQINNKRTVKRTDLSRQTEVKKPTRSISEHSRTSQTPHEKIYPLRSRNFSWELDQNSSRLNKYKTLRTRNSESHKQSKYKSSRHSPEIVTPCKVLVQDITQGRNEETIIKRKRGRKREISQIGTIIPKKKAKVIRSSDDDDDEKTSTTSKSRSYFDSSSSKIVNVKRSRIRSVSESSEGSLHANINPIGSSNHSKSENKSTKGISVPRSSIIFNTLKALKEKQKLGQFVLPSSYANHKRSHNSLQRKDQKTSSENKDHHKPTSRNRENESQERITSPVKKKRKPSNKPSAQPKLKPSQDKHIKKSVSKYLDNDCSEELPSSPRTTSPIKQKRKLKYRKSSGGSKPERETSSCLESDTSAVSKRSCIKTKSSLKKPKKSKFRKIENENTTETSDVSEKADDGSASLPSSRFEDDIDIPGSFDSQTDNECNDVFADDLKTKSTKAEKSLSKAKSPMKKSQAKVKMSNPPKGIQKKTIQKKKVGEEKLSASLPNKPRIVITHNSRGSKGAAVTGKIKSCPYCQQFHTRVPELLRKHITQVHPHKCQICRTDFKNKDEAKNHRRIHVKQFHHCTVCQRDFASKFVFARHERSLQHLTLVRVQRQILEVILKTYINTTGSTATLPDLSQFADLITFPNMNISTSDSLDTRDPVKQAEDIRRFYHDNPEIQNLLTKVEKSLKDQTNKKTSDIILPEASGSALDQTTSLSTKVASVLPMVSIDNSKDLVKNCPGDDIITEVLANQDEIMSAITLNDNDEILQRNSFECFDPNKLPTLLPQNNNAENLNENVFDTFPVTFDLLNYNYDQNPCFEPCDLSVANENLIWGSDKCFDFEFGSNNPYDILFNDKTFGLASNPTAVPVSFSQPTVSENSTASVETFVGLLNSNKKNCGYQNYDLSISNSTHVPHVTENNNLHPRVNSRDSQNSLHSQGNNRGSQNNLHSLGNNKDSLNKDITNNSTNCDDLSNSSCYQLTEDGVQIPQSYNTPIMSETFTNVKSRKSISSATTTSEALLSDTPPLEPSYKIPDIQAIAAESSDKGPVQLIPVGVVDKVDSNSSNKAENDCVSQNQTVINSVLGEFNVETKDVSKYSSKDNLKVRELQKVNFQFPINIEILDVPKDNSQCEEIQRENSQFQETLIHTVQGTILKHVDTEVVAPYCSTSCPIGLPDSEKLNSKNCAEISLQKQDTKDGTDNADDSFTVLLEKFLPPHLMSNEGEKKVFVENMTEDLETTSVNSVQDVDTEISEQKNKQLLLSNFKSDLSSQKQCSILCVDDIAVTPGIQKLALDGTEQRNVETQSYDVESTKIIHHLLNKVPNDKTLILDVKAAISFILNQISDAQEEKMSDKAVRTSCAISEETDKTPGEISDEVVRIYDKAVRTSCEISEAIRTSCEISDEAIRTSCEISEDAFRTSCEISDEAVAMPCKISDEAIRTSCEIPDEAIGTSCQKSEDAIMTPCETSNEIVRICNEAVKTSCEISDKAVETPCETSDEAVRTPYEISDEAIGTSCEILDKAAKTPCETSDGAFTTPCAISDKAIRTSCEIPDEAVEMPCEIPIEGVRRTPCEISDEVVKTSCEISDEAVEMPCEISNEGVRTPCEISDEVIRTSCEVSDAASVSFNKGTCQSIEPEVLLLNICTSPCKKLRMRYHQKFVTSSNADKDIVSESCDKETISFILSNMIETICWEESKLKVNS
ncbi:hypothetical protein SNE40_008249 [Patella caerulea]|uniref:C2H2-type domain-containing protein n=1 Tax=Patella caerulea TaxID=87958 RepID=A0AAN8K7S9_PATCE